MNRTEKTIDNLKDDAVNGEEIKGGGAAVNVFGNSGPILPGSPDLPNGPQIINGPAILDPMNSPGPDLPANTAADITDLPI